MIWSDLLSVVSSNNSFCITTHKSPDGDSIGSQLALYWYLTSLGKEVVIFDNDPVPKKLMFLRNCEHIVTKRPERTFDILFVLDASNPDRLGWDGIRTIAPYVINIDHHRDNSKFGDQNYINATMPATGAIIHDFFTCAGIQYPDFVAEALYAAMMTDTGAFRFTNTTGDVLKRCGDLVEKGANPATIYEKIYVSLSCNAITLHSRVWSSMKFYYNNQICCLEMPLALIDQLGATYGDSEGLSDLTTLALGVKIGVFIKYTDTETHFSLRSKEAIDVGRIAQQIAGGGGHSSAAGCTLQEPLEKAKKILFDILIKYIDAVDQKPEVRIQ